LSKWKYLQDWFGFFPEWFVGAPVVILLLYGATLASFIPNANEYLGWLSYSVNNYSILIFFLLIPIGYLVRINKIAHNLRNVYGNTSELLVIESIGFEILAVGFGLAFGLQGLFAFTIKDPFWYWALIIANLTFSNICAILSRTVVRDSPIGNYIVGKIWIVIKKYKK